jgi:RNA polymerase sigma-70 factor, ECF subfamily
VDDPMSAAVVATETGSAAEPSLGPAGLEPFTPLSHGSVTDPDAGLVAAARGGDLAAFNTLVVRYQDYLLALATRVIGDRDTAADAVQEAFFSAYRNIGSFRGERFRAWLTRITVNAATDVLRSRKRRPTQPYPEFDDETWQPPDTRALDPEREAIRRSRARVLSAALARLTDGQRTAIVLFDVEGFDYPEIARLTGVELGTVKSRIHRGRLMLRELLADSMELFRP